MSSVREVPPLEVVYVLGNSFSGSTVLGFLMAGSPEVLCLGELKMHNRIGTRICSCGATGRACPFWSYWDAQGYRLYSGSLWARVKLSAKLLLGRSADVGVREPMTNDDGLFLQQIWQESGEPRYLVDISKSLWRLAHLSRTPGINLSVIHVRRQMHGTIASFVRRFGHFWQPLARCLLNELLCKRFLALHPEVRSLEVRHEHLCSDPDAVMKEIGDFLGVDYTDYLRNLETLETHVRGGNQETISQKRVGLQLRSPEEEEERWRNLLGPYRTRLIDWLTVGVRSLQGLAGGRARDRAVAGSEGRA